MIFRSQNSKNFAKMLLAHHPACVSYRSHVITVRNVSFCLGCTAFYCGIIIGGILAYFNIFSHSPWFDMVLTATLCYLPTIFRLFHLSFFFTWNKKARFTFRWLLGFGVAIGSLSILKAPTIQIKVIQILLGSLLCAGIILERIITGSHDKPCDECRYIPYDSCPGFAPHDSGQK